MKRLQQLFLFLFIFSSSCVYADIATEIGDLFGSLTGDTNHSLRVSERKRDFRVHTPPSLKNGLPLIVVLHPESTDAREFARQTKWSELADRVGFLVLYPEAFKSTSSEEPISWDFEMDRDFIQQATHKTEELYGADLNKVFLLGHGKAAGIFAMRLVCEDSSLFSGVAIGNVLLPKSYEAYCAEATPTPLMHYFAEEAKNILSMKSSLQYMSADRVLESWGAWSGCEGEIGHSRLTGDENSGVPSISRYATTGCFGNRGVEQLRFEGDFEGWPNPGSLEKPFLTREFELALYIWDYWDEATSVNFDFPEAEESL